MKIKKIIKGIVSVALIFVPLQAQDYIIDKFDDLISESQWIRWWGSAPISFFVDFSKNADSNKQSGSLMVIVDFNVELYGGDNQFAFRKDFPEGSIDATKYVKLEFDLLWDASSPKRNTGDYGYLEYGFRLSDWSQLWLGGTTITEEYDKRWIHVEVPIDPATPRLNEVVGIVLKMWAGGNNGLNGTTIFWIDNIKLIPNPSQEIQRPQLFLQKPNPGLLIAATAPGQQWQRQNIRLLLEKPDGGYRSVGWVGQGRPVTYSFTIKDFDGIEAPGFQAHMFLVPDSDLPWGPDDSAIDWNAPHVIFFQITVNEAGRAIGRLMYKVNQPSGNSMLWNTDPEKGPVGTLIILESEEVIGSWMVTFENDTNVKITSPDGNTQSAVFPTEHISYFTRPIYVYFGVQPNRLEYIGKAALIEEIKITGVLDPLEDNFKSGELNSTIWKKVATDPNGIIVIPYDSKWQISWTLPAVGFVLEIAESLIPPSWQRLDISTAVLGPNKRMMLFLRSNDIIVKDRGFFRMVRIE